MLTGLLNIIPVLGAAICIALALLVAAIDSWGRVLGVAIFYLLYIQLENSYLTPRIMRNSVDLPGLAILIALLLGFALEGIPGAMVSVPTAVLVSVLVDEYLVQKDRGECSRLSSRQVSRNGAASAAAGRSATAAFMHPASDRNRHQAPGEGCSGSGLGPRSPRGRRGSGCAGALWRGGQLQFARALRVQQQRGELARQSADRSSRPRRPACRG